MIDEHAVIYGLLEVSETGEKQRYNAAIDIA